MLKCRFLNDSIIAEDAKIPIAPSYFTANQTVEIPKILVKYGFSGIKKGTIFR